MPKLAAAIAALPILFLPSCADREPAAAENAVASASGANGLADSPVPEPAEPGGGPAAGAADPVPPPDAVSHPNGYLPPAPAEPEPASSNASGPDSGQPATEDEYIRNRQ